MLQISLELADQDVKYELISEPKPFKQLEPNSAPLSSSSSCSLLALWEPYLKKSRSKPIKIILPWQIRRLKPKPTRRYKGQTPQLRTSPRQAGRARADLGNGNIFLPRGDGALCENPQQTGQQEACSPPAGALKAPKFAARQAQVAAMLSSCQCYATKLQTAATPGRFSIKDPPGCRLRGGIEGGKYFQAGIFWV